MTATLLDLTRTLRRVGQGVTGIDRVERAYLTWFSAELETAFGLVRTPFGYLLLDRKGLRGFRQRLVGEVPWGVARGLSRVVRRPEAVQRAESDLRRLAIGQTAPVGLAVMLRRRLGDDIAYYNVGHSNLTTRVMRAVSERHVMVHDVIPLAHPAFQLPTRAEAFRAKVQTVSAFADRVIYPSSVTETAASAVFVDMGRRPTGQVVPLGVEVTGPDAAAVPAGVMPERPYFVMVGTIEPRKNHMFVLDLWERMGRDAPPLVICGKRGWHNADVFARLDALPQNGPIKEVNELPDAAVSALVKGAQALLFPTLAEGFGLPPVEAAMLGTRSICNDLPVLAQNLGKQGHFLSVSEPQLWLELLKKMEKSGLAEGRVTGFEAPSWSDHFNAVLSMG